MSSRALCCFLVLSSLGVLSLAMPCAVAVLSSLDVLLCLAMPCVVASLQMGKTSAASRVPRPHRSLSYSL